MEKKGPRNVIKVQKTLTLDATKDAFKNAASKIRDVLNESNGLLVTAECSLSAVGARQDRLMLVIVYTINPAFKVSTKLTSTADYFFEQYPVNDFNAEDITNATLFLSTIAGEKGDHYFSVTFEQSSNLA